MVGVGMSPCDDAGVTTVMTSWYGETVSVSAKVNLIRFAGLSIYIFSSRWSLRMMLWQAQPFMLYSVVAIEAQAKILNVTKIQLKKVEMMMTCMLSFPISLGFNQVSLLRGIFSRRKMICCLISSWLPTWFCGEMKYRCRLSHFTRPQACRKKWRAYKNPTNREREQKGVLPVYCVFVTSYWHEWTTPDSVWFVLTLFKPPFVLLGHNNKHGHFILNP